MIPVTIIRQSGFSEGVVATVNPTPGSNISKKLMGEETATLTFELNAMYNFSVGDSAVILGETWYISKPPQVFKRSRYNYVYSLTFESAQYKLRNAQFLFYNSNNLMGESDFSFTGTADDFMNLILLNANRIGGNWVKGGVAVTGYKTITFSKEDCLSVLSRVAEEFETEFFVSGNTIHLAKRQQQTVYTFMYGRNYGLYSISRELEDEVIITRLYVYGGNQNIPSTYRNFSPRLLMNSVDDCLPTDLSCEVTDNAPTLTHTYKFTFTPPQSSGVVNLQLEYRISGSSGAWSLEVHSPDSPIEIELPNGDYEFRFRSLGGTCDNAVTEVLQITETTTQLLLQKLSVMEKNVLIHGLIEGTLIVEDIFPQREGVVTAADVTNFYKFKDTNIDFNVNDNLLPGLSAKVVFNTGQLAGYKFDISAFDNATKEFTILKNKDEKALDLPSANFRPAIGDKYIIVDMLMPKEYVTAAEVKLRAKAAEYLDKKSSPQYKYIVDCDPAYFRKNNIVLQLGDIVQIQDNELQVNKPVRVVSMTRSLVDEFEYSVDLGEKASQGTIAALQSAQTINNTNISNTATAFNNNALLNGTHIGNLRIQQGTILIEDIGTAADTSTMKKLWIDPDGKVWKET